MNEHQDRLPEQNRDELPEHERRPEGDTGGGLTSLGISAEQRGPVQSDVTEDQTEDERANEPDEPPPSYRAHSG